MHCIVPSHETLVVGCNVENGIYCNVLISSKVLMNREPKIYEKKHDHMYMGLAAKSLAMWATSPVLSANGPRLIFQG